MLNTTDVARLLKVDPRTVLAWSRRGLIPAPAISEGKIHRWKPQDIHAWLNKS